MNRINTSKPEFGWDGFVFDHGQSCEQDAWYAQDGRIVFAKSRGLEGIGLLRKSRDDRCREEVNDMQHGTVQQTFIDDTHPGGPVERTITYVARCDREEDYRTAWTEFEKRGLK